MKRSDLLASLVLCVACALPADEIGVAKSALRDGHYDIARKHADKAEGDEAALVSLESYARQGRWTDLIKSIDLMPDPTADGVVYYRALALARTGEGEAAEKLLSSAAFKDPVLKRLSLLLRAELARRADKPSVVVELAKEAGFPKDTVESRMILAWAYEKTGDVTSAEQAWSAVLADGHSDDAAVASAATHLGTVAALRKAYDRITTPSLRRPVGLRLGREQLSQDASFEDGEALIRRLAKDDPDAPGAKEAFLALANALLHKERFQAAADVYREALASWPEEGRQESVQENRAWALRKSGKSEEALSAYERAVELATNDVVRAQVLLAQGDVLAELKRGEESRAKYQIVLEKYPDTPSGRKLKEIVALRDLESEGRSLFRSCCFPEAQEKFAELARRDPSRKPRMDYLTALCLYGQGRDDEAFEAASRLAKDSSDATIRAEATLWLAKYSYNAGRWRESCDLFGNYATNLVPSSAQAPSALTWAARASLVAREYRQTVSLVTTMLNTYPKSDEAPSALLVQGQALVSLTRFDDAILAFDQALQRVKDLDPTSEAAREIRVSARRFKADALFVMGADNPLRYKEALEAYKALGFDVTQPDDRLALAFKIARTYEKLKQFDEAIDQYYTQVLLVYWDERQQKGTVFNEESKAYFARAGYWLDEEYRRRGLDDEAESVLRYLVKGDAGHSVKVEAKRRLARLQKKGTH